MFCEALNNFSPVPGNFFVVPPQQKDDDSWGERVVEHYELEYDDAGTGHVLVDGIPFAACARALHFRRPGMVVEGIGVYSGHYFEFDFSPQREVVEELGSMPCHYLMDGAAEASALMDSIFSEYYGDSPIRLLSFKIHVMRLFELMLSQWYSDTRSLGVNRSAAANIGRSIAYINEHLSQSFTVEELAGMAGYSVYHYTRLFKAVTRWTPVQYLNRGRITRAKRLLVETQLPIEEIVAACGFNNESYFFRAFKELCGVTPGQYRQKHQLYRVPGA